jgi:hypothetical protein
MGHSVSLFARLKAAIDVDPQSLAPVKSQEMADIKTYCMSDIERLCKGIEPGGGRILNVSKPIRRK